MYPAQRFPRSAAISIPHAAEASLEFDSPNKALDARGPSLPEAPIRCGLSRCPRAPSAVTRATLLDGGTHQVDAAERCTAAIEMIQCQTWYIPCGHIRRDAQGLRGLTTDVVV